MPEAAIFASLPKENFHVSIMGTCTDDFRQWFEEQSITIYKDFPNSKFDRGFIKRLKALLIAEQIDIVHVFHAITITNVSFALRGLPIKLVAYLGAKAPDFFDPTAYLSYLNPRIDALICVSEFVKKSLILQKVNPNKLFVIPKKPIIDPSILNDAPQFPGHTAVHTKICCIANNRKVKGLKYLIKAIPLLPTNVALYLIGRDLDSLKVPTSVAPRIFKLGYISNPLPYLQACDIYVQPSLSEGLPKTIMEAMALGKMIIATDCEGNQELIQDAYNGILVPRRSSHALAEAIQSIIKDPKKAATFSKNAKHSFDQLPGHEQSAMRLQEVYWGLCGESSLDIDRSKSY